MSDYSYGQAYYTPPTSAKRTPPSNFKSGAGPSGYKYGSAYGLDQSMRAVNEDDVVAGAMNEHKGTLVIHNDPTMLPKAGAQMAGSLPTDIETKARYLAKSLFPDLPEDQALARIGSDNGRLYYIDQDNKAYYAEPSFDPIAAPGRTIAEIPHMVASNIGPALPVVGGMFGGATTSGFGGGVPGAAAGGAVGDFIRQTGAHFITGEEKPLTERILQTAKEAGGQALGQTIGLGVAKGVGAAISRNPLKVSGYDASTLTPGRISQIEANTQKARNLGVTVTPGEAGNVTSLLQRQRQIGRQGEGADVLNDFYVKRNTEQLPAGWERTLNTISPQTSPGLGARGLADASEEVIKAAKGARSEQSGPLFTEAYAKNPSVASPEIDLILKTPAGQQALKDAAVIMQNSREFMALPDPEKTALVKELVSIGKMEDPKTGAGVASGLRLQSLQYVKEALWDQYKELAISQPRKAQSVLDNYFNLRNELYLIDSTAVTDAAKRKVLQPGLYQQANEAHAGMSPEVDALENGLVGLAAKDRAAGWQNTPRTMFDISSADSISITQAKQAFAKAGKMDEWNAAIRSYLDNAFQGFAKQEQGPASSMWKTFKADKRQYANLKAATTPRQMQALDDFFQVAEMIKRAPKEGAPTATDLNKRPDFAGPAAKFFGNAAKGTNPLNWADMVGDKIFDISAGKNIGNMARLITSPDAMSSLRRLKVLKPGTEKFIAELTYFTEALGMSQVGFQPPDKLPPAAR